MAVSVPKRRRKIKELNKKEAVGDLLDAFKEVREQWGGERAEFGCGTGRTTTNTMFLWLQVNPGVPEVENQPPVGSNPGPEPEGSSEPPRPEDSEETWDSKEDKIHNAENIQPAEQKYEYKSGTLKGGLGCGLLLLGPPEIIVLHPVLLADQWKPLNLEEKKRYDREFLLGFNPWH